MYFIGLDVHKRTISYCVKDAAGHVHQEGKIGSTRRELDGWIRTMPQPRMIAMEATIELWSHSPTNEWPAQLGKLLAHDRNRTEEHLFASKSARLRAADESLA